MLEHLQNPFIATLSNQSSGDTGATKPRQDDALPIFSSPPPHVKNGNANRKSKPEAEQSAQKHDAASLVSRVLHDIATGTLRFALFGTSDGGVEVWRAASESASKNGVGNNVMDANQASMAPKIEPLVCDAKTAREILGGIGVTSLWKLEKRGIIKRLPDFPKAMFSVAHLKEAVNKQNKKQTVFKI